MKDFQKIRGSLTLRELTRAFYALADFVIETTTNIERRMDEPESNEAERERKWLMSQRKAMIRFANLLTKYECDERANVWRERAEEIKKKLEAKKS